MGLLQLCSWVIPRSNTSVSGQQYSNLPDTCHTHFNRNLTPLLNKTTLPKRNSYDKLQSIST